MLRPDRIITSQKQKTFIHAMLIMVAIAPGCASHQRGAMLAPQKVTIDTNALSQSVEVNIDPEFHRSRPSCVLLVPIGIPSTNTSLNYLIEAYFAFHLSFRFDRIIFGRARNQAASKAGLDIFHINDRFLFHEIEDCGAEIELSVVQAQSEFAMVWGKLDLQIEAKLTRAKDGFLLWSARHVASRSTGGIAFSPFGIVTNSIEASRFMADGNQFVSIISDATRKLVTTIP